MAKGEYPSVGVAITGEPKTLKTTLAFTFPQPIAVFAFDVPGVQRVKKRFPQVKVDVYDYEFAPVDTAGKNVDFALEIWRSFKEDYKAVCTSKDYKTLLVDTATLLYDICRYAYREETDQRNILKVQYEEVYARMSWVLMAPIYAGKNIVSTYHLKDEYKGGEATGGQVLDGYKRTAGISDVVLENRLVREKDTKGKYVHNVYTKFIASGYDYTLTDIELVNTDYKNLMVTMFPDVEV